MNDVEKQLENILLLTVIWPLAYKRVYNETININVTAKEKKICKMFLTI